MTQHAALLNKRNGYVAHVRDSREEARNKAEQLVFANIDVIDRKVVEENWQFFTMDPVATFNRLSPYEISIIPVTP